MKPFGLLNPIPPTTTPFYRVGIDKLGPFKESMDGNKFVLVCTDYCTKYVVACAVRNGSALESAKFLTQKVILQHGSPRELITDRGTEFVNKLIEEINKVFSITHNRTCAYHPRSNGQTERINRTLATMISHYVNGQHTDWDRFLSHVVFAYNTSKHDSTGYSPFFLLHGYEADLAIDATLNTSYNESQFSFEHIRYAQEARRIANEVVAIGQQKAKERFDKARNHVEFKNGDLVYLRTPNRKVGRTEKLLPAYAGPYIVIRQTADNNYEICNSSGKSDIVNVERMKLYTVRELDASEPNTSPRKVVFNDKVTFSDGEVSNVRDNSSSSVINEPFRRRSKRLQYRKFRNN